MSKIRFPEIDNAITSHPRYDEFMQIMAEMYTASPNKGQIAFVYAVQDQFRNNVKSQSRTSRGGSPSGTGWRHNQIAQFSGRGAKWYKVTGRILRHLNEHLDSWAEEGDDVEDYRRWIEAADFGWIRYAGPRGTESEPQLAFEVRIFGSKVDHPNHLLKISQLLWDQQAENRSVLGGTPFSMKLED